MAKTKPPDAAVSRVTVLEAITAPLGFFVLALLIVEAFLAAVLIGSNMDPKDKVVGMWAGVGMFVFVVGVAAVLVWFRPTNLTYDKHAHLIDRGKLPHGRPGDTNPQPVRTTETPGEERR